MIYFHRMSLNQNSKDMLRTIPATETIIVHSEAAALIKSSGRSETIKAVKKAADELRKALSTDKEVEPDALTVSAIIKTAAELIKISHSQKLKKVINCTGIILHTGLGRAPMSDAAAKEVSDTIRNCTIQMDLESGKRNRRETALLALLKDLTGCEDALVVNNNAAATMLVLKALAQGKEAIVSRGELIEIGGSFRLPDIMKESGAILKEVGTTNKTHLKDYEQAISPATALIFKAHKSNYKIIGFTKEVEINELAALGKKRGITVIDDLGAGAMVDLKAYGLEHEPTVQESIEAGADIVLFSGDKLIGGPQAGIIVGKKELIAKIKADSLYRVFRVCKMTIAALEATLKSFLRPEHLTAANPLYALISRDIKVIETMANEVAKKVGDKKKDWEISVIKEISFIGGGSLPGMEMPTYAVRITSKEVKPEALALALRKSDTPVIPRISEDAVLLDMRTVFPEEMPILIKACSEVKYSLY